MNIKPIHTIVFLFMQRLNNCSIKFRKLQLKLFDLEIIQCGGNMVNLRPVVHNYSVKQSYPRTCDSMMPGQSSPENENNYHYYVHTGKEAIKIDVNVAKDKK
jgi:hypothetical protein